MKKAIPTPIVVASLAVIVLVIGFFALQSMRGAEGTGTPAERELNVVLERTHGDVSKMTADEKKVYDESVKKGLYDPTGANLSSSSPGSAAPKPTAVANP